jgi:hypothetical protein
MDIKFHSSILAFLVMALLFSPMISLAEDSETLAGKGLKIIVGEKVLTVSLIDSATTRDFITLLPMTVKVDDYASREKYWRLPRQISSERGHQ